MARERARAILRAHGLARYGECLKGLDVDDIAALTLGRVRELGIMDVGEQAKMMKMARAQRGGERKATKKANDEEDERARMSVENACESAREDGSETNAGVEDVAASGGGGEASPRAKVESAPSTSTREAKASKIRVCVRKRPLNSKEHARRERDICTNDGPSELTVWEPKVKVDLSRFVEKHVFAFDNVFDEFASNDDVYESEVEPLVEFVFSRAHATCFAYGQTGSGKTYTMQPLPGRAARDVLGAIHRAENERASLELWVSSFEIYGGRVFDLLNGRRRLRVMEDSKAQICVVGLQEYKVDSAETFDRLVEHSNKARCVGSTGANAESSRSHAILQLLLKKPAEQRRQAVFEDKCEPSAETFGKLSFIDLAGSERGADTTDNDRQTRIEGADINKSLLALKECIRALDSGASHVPFRGSKLTEVLRDSFLGDSRTVMIANISPAEGSCEHTLNTLRYADRVKELSRAGGGSSGESVRIVEPPASLARASTHSAPAAGARDPKMTSFAPRTSLSSTPRKSTITRKSTPSSSSPSARANSESITTPGGGFRASRKSPTSSRRAAVNDPTSSTPDLHRPSSASAADMTPQEAEHAHDALIEVILGEEDAIIAAHRAHIERSMDVVKSEMDFLARVDKPGSAVDVYVDELDAILAERADDVARLRARVERFRALLRQEEELSRRVLTSMKSASDPIPG